MKKVSIAVGWDASGKPRVLAVAQLASLVLPALQKLPADVVEAAVYKDPFPFKRRRLAVSVTPAPASPTVEASAPAAEVPADKPKRKKSE